MHLLLILVAVSAGPRPLAAGGERAGAKFINQCEDQAQRKRYQGDYPAALAAVEACLDEAPGSGELLLLRASILHAKDDLGKALDGYRQAFEAGLHGPSRRKVRRIIRDLGPIENTRVRVEVENGPAEVYLVSKALGVRCVADPVCTLGRLPGRTRVYVEREGFAPVRERVRVTRNHTTELAVALEELPSRLDIEVVPRDAAVMLDGQVLDTASKPRDIAPGEHRLRVSLAGFAPHEQVISAHRGQPVSVRVELAELVRVKLSVPAAEVSLDGQPVTLEDGMLRLPPGERRAHVVSARAAGYRDATVEIPKERPRGHEVELELREIPPPPEPAPAPAPGWSRAKLAAVATTGTLAAAGYALGAGFALSAHNRRGAVEKRCTRDSEPGVVCGSDAVQVAETARDRAATAQVSIALGAVATVGMLAAVHWNEPARGGMSQTRLWSMGASAGVAAAAAGLGVWYGMQSRSESDQARACREEPGCSRVQFVLSARARDDARVANLGFAVAGAAAASAAFLWLTAPSGGEHAAPVRVTPVVDAEQVGLGISGALP